MTFTTGLGCVSQAVCSESFQVLNEGYDGKSIETQEKVQL